MEPFIKFPLLIFMADYPGDDGCFHRRRFELYRALAETLEAKFADDVGRYLQASAPGRQGCNAA